MESTRPSREGCRSGCARAMPAAVHDPRRVAPGTRARETARDRGTSRVHPRRVASLPAWPAFTCPGMPRHRAQREGWLHGESAVRCRRRRDRDPRPRGLFPRREPAGRSRFVIRSTARLRRLVELPRVPREVLPALVDLDARPGDAAVRRRVREDPPHPPAAAGHDRRVHLPRRHRRAERGDRGDRPQGRDALPDRARPRRQERLLLPDPLPQRPAADPPPGLRRRHEAVVRRRGERRPPLPGRAPERGRPLDGHAVHVQHQLLQLPRQPALDQLRRGEPTPTTPPGPSRESTARPATACRRSTTRSPGRLPRASRSPSWA